MQSIPLYLCVCLRGGNREKRKKEIVQNVKIVCFVKLTWVIFTYSFIFLDFTTNVFEICSIKESGYQTTGGKVHWLYWLNSFFRELSPISGR